MSVNLKKGQKVNLRKEDGNTLKNVIIGLGWDEVERKGFLFSKPKPIDCDASAFLCQDGKVVTNKDVVYFGQLTHSSGSVKHMGDNLTGEGDGDDEQIYVRLDQVPLDYNKIVIVVNIYDAYNRKQDFGLINNAFCRVFDADTGKEICKYDLTEDYKGYTAMICGELIRDHDNEWHFNAVGEATRDGCINDIVKRYR